MSGDGRLARLVGCANTERQEGQKPAFSKLLKILIPAALLAGVGSSDAAQMTIPGQFEVSDVGSASYSIPISAVPGTAGMEPKLSLSYDSRSGNGLVGMGWSLEGLPSVVRCPRTKAQDGERASIHYDARDRFCLDGERLVAVSGVYGTDGTEYRTEREGFSKIVSHGTAGGGPAWFEVWTKAGLILEFGNTADSRIEAQGKDAVRLWAVNRTRDTKGNYFDVSYVENNANGEYRPDRIDYTGNQDASPPLAPYASVRFVYEDRPAADRVPYYQAGSLIRTTKRLSGVQTYHGGDLVLDYRLAYDVGATTQRSRLAGVTLCDASGTACLPAAAFTAAPGGSGFTIETAATQLDDTNGVNWIGDFNGDGRSDIASWISTTRLRMNLFNGTGFEVEQWDTNLNSASNDWNWLGDFNGDGRTDIASKVSDTEIRVHLSTGTRFVAYNWDAQLNTGASTFSDAHQLGDFNGDGRMDIAAWVSSSEVRIHLSQGNGFSIETWNASSTATIHTFTGNGTFEVTGSGPDDLLAVEYLVVAGGGGGSGGQYAGGGGGGGLLTGEMDLLPGEYTVTVGAGGAITVNGGDSSFGDITAKGGGYAHPTGSGLPGGSGGGGSGGQGINYAGGAGVPGQGHDGGSGYYTGMGAAWGGGGGGAGSVGGNASHGNYGAGGDGLSSSISGTLVHYSAGGDGQAGGSGGLGYGNPGSGGNYSSTGQSGIVIVRYAGAQRATGGTVSSVTPVSLNASGSKPFKEWHQLGDFNGDGLTDIAAWADGSSLSMHLSTGGGFTSETWAGQFNTSGTKPFQEGHRLGDFNGDGKTDIAAWIDGTSLRVHLSTGEGFVTEVWTGQFNTSGSKPFQEWNRLGDFNGDGKTDIASWISGSSLRVHYSTGDAFVVADPNWSAQFKTDGSTPFINWHLMSDFNGDSKTDIAAWVSSTSLRMHYVAAPLADLLTTIDNGIGAATTIAYEPLSKGGLLYTGNSDIYACQYPCVDVQGAIYVVSEVKASSGIKNPDGTDGEYRSTYGYANARADVDGRGFLGFEQMVVIDEQSGIKQTTFFRQDWPFVGLASLRVKELNSIELNRTENEYAATDLGGGRWYPYLNKSVEWSREIDDEALPAVTTAYDYDAFGNATGVKVTTHSEGTYTKTTDNVYAAPDTANWILGRLARSEITSESYDGTAGPSPGDPNSDLIDVNIEIGADTDNPDLVALATASGWDGGSKINLEVRVLPGVVVGSSSATVAALRLGKGFPEGSFFTLVNQGRIVGRGGSGGWPGQAGGTAVSLYAHSAIDNTAGEIWGGGGGGGQGANVYIGGPNSPLASGGAGGLGAGPAGAGGSSGPGIYSDTCCVQWDDGTQQCIQSGSYTLNGGSGGAGGTFAGSGATGSNDISCSGDACGICAHPQVQHPAAVGGPGGKAIVTNGYGITWFGQGDLRGAAEYTGPGGDGGTVEASVDADEVSVTVSASADNVSIASLARTAGWDGWSPVNLTVAVEPGVVIGSASTSNPALDITGVSLPDGSKVTLINRGQIIGHGGSGGSGSTGNPNTGSPGGRGGDAIGLGVDIRIDNTMGGIYGGGGGGGGGAGVSGLPGGHGGTGAGSQGGASGGGASQSRDIHYEWGESEHCYSTHYSGAGGSGGGYGSNGGGGGHTSSVGGGQCGLGYYAGGAGGAAGKAIADFGAATITWIGGTQGDVRGPVNCHISGCQDYVPTVSGPVALNGIEDVDLLITETVLLANASDDDGDTLSVQNLQASAGKLVAHGDGTWTLTPPLDFIGDIALTYWVTDGITPVPASGMASFAPANDAPRLLSEIPDQSADENTAYLLNAADHFTDVDAGDSLTYAATLSPAGALPGWLGFDAGTGVLSGTPLDGDEGAITIRVTATDLALETVEDSFVLTVNNTNDAPVVSAPVTIPGTEDTALVITGADLLANATDTDVGDVLSVLNLAAASGSLVDNGDATWTLTPPANFNGAIGLTYEVSDGTLSAAASGTADFAAVNDIPVLSSSIPNQLTDAESPYTFDASVHFADVDVGDTATYSAELQGGGALPAWLSIGTDSGILSGTPASGQEGTLQITVIIADGSSATASDTFELVVDFANRAPVISGPVTVPGTEDTALLITESTLLANATDADVGDVLSVLNLSASAGVLADNGNGNWTLTPAANFNGPIALTYDVTDSEATVGATGTADFAAVNDAPTLSSAIPDQAAEEEVAFSFDTSAHFADVDAGDSLIYSAVLSGGGTLPAWLSMDAQTGILSGTPADGDDGILSITVTATDSGAEAASDTFDLTIDNVVVSVNLAASVNNPDVLALAQATGWDGITPVNVVITVEPGVVVGSSSASTPSLIVNPFPSGSKVALINQGRIQGKGGDGGRGSNTTGSTSTHGEDGGDALFLSHAITIDNTAGEIWGGGGGGGGGGGCSPSTGCEWADGGGGGGGAGTAVGSGGTAVYSYAIGDPGTDSAGGAGKRGSGIYRQCAGGNGGGPGEAGTNAYTTYGPTCAGQKSGGAGGEAITANSHVITWAGAQGDVRGALQCSISSCENYAPVISGPVSLSGTEDTALVITETELLANASDADAGDTLNVQNLSVSTGSLVDNGNDTWTLTPAADFNGAIGLTYRVSDGITPVPASGTATFAPANDAPIVSLAIPDQSTDENTAYSYGTSVHFSDIDTGDILSYSATLFGGGALPAWLSIDPGTGVLSGTPLDGDEGLIAVEVTATDTASAAVSDVFDLTVVNTNDVPAISGPVSVPGTEDNVLTITQVALLGTATDPDVGDTLSAQNLVASAGNLVDNGDGTWTLTPATNFHGAIDLTFEVTDGILVVPATGTADFASVNDVPTISLVIPDQVTDADTLYTFDASAHFADADVGDTAVYSAELQGGGALPAWLSIGTDTGILSGTPASGQEATHLITVTITDGSSATASDTFELVVDFPNRLPVIGGPVTVPGTEDTALLITEAALLANATDADVGDVLSVLNLLASAGVLADNGNDTWTLTPDADFNGDVTLSYEVSDGTVAVPAAGTAAFAAVNDTPTLSSAIPHQSTDEEVAFSFDASAHFIDVDAGDILSYSATLSGGGALPAWLSMDAQTGILSGTPADTDVGTITITVVAADTALATTSATFDLTVINRNVFVSFGVVNNPDIAALAQANGWDGTSWINLEITVNSGVLVGSSSTSTPSLTIPAFPGGSTVTLINQGQIIGRGGSGGSGGNGFPVAGRPGNVGGVALTLNMDVTIDNSSGGIYGGGGGGGGGAGFGDLPGGHGGTGAGSQGGASGGGASQSRDVHTEWGESEHCYSTHYSGAGGGGGGYGSNGGGGGHTWSVGGGQCGLGQYSGSAGGAAGKAIIANSHAITWAGDKGDVRGAINCGAGSCESYIPVVSGPVSFTGTEDVPLTVTEAELLANASDGDPGDTLSVQNLNVSAGGLVDNGNNSWTLTPPADFNGTVDLTYQVTDGTTPVPASGTASFAAANDVPRLLSEVPDQSADENAPYAYDASVHFTDVDTGDSLTYAATLSPAGALPGWLGFDMGTGVLSGTPVQGDEGVVGITITATDLALETVEDSFVLTVNNTNNAPVISGPVSVPGTEDTALVITEADLLANATDADVGDTLTVQNVAASAGNLVDNGDGTWTLTPDPDFNGAIDLTFEVTDGILVVPATGTADFAPVNDIPVLSSSIPNQLTDADSPYTFDASVHFADVDVGDTATYSAELQGGGALPAWLSIGTDSGVLSGTPVSGDEGTITLVVTRTDGASATASDTFELVVDFANRAPVISGPVTVPGTEDTALVITEAALLANATDADIGDVLSVLNLSASAGSLADNGDKTWTLTPAAEFNGPITLTYDVTDSEATVGATGTADFAAVNDAPILSSAIPDQDGEPDIAYSFDTSAHFTDVDTGDTLTYTAALSGGGALPGWLSLDAQTGVLSGTPGSGDAGTVSIDVTATDGSAETVSDSFDLTVAQRDISVSITSSVNNPDISSLAQAAGWDGSSWINLEVTVQSGVIIGSASNTDPALDTSSFSSGSSVTLINYGRIQGAGGNGGHHGGSNGGGDGYPGGPAIRVTQPVSIDNRGEIWGGGGGGGGGGNGISANGGSGGGGAGTVPGAQPDVSTPWFGGGQPGTDTSGGAGGAGYGGGGNGGAGGGPGMAGSHGANGAANNPGSGGAGGEAIVANGYTVTWLGSQGDVRGAINCGAGSCEIHVPAISGPVTFSGTEDTALDITESELMANASGGNGGALSVLNLSASAGSLVDNGNGTWTLTPAADFNGSIDLTYDVTDGTTPVPASGTASFAPANDAPRLLSEIPDQSADENAAYLLNASAHFTDVDAGDSLTYAATLSPAGALPGWLGFDPGTGVLSGTPLDGDEGATTIRVTATDLALETTEDSFVLTVVNTNDAPVVSAPVAIPGTEDTALVITEANLLANATDPDMGDILSAQNLAASTGNLVDNGDATWTLTPDADFNGAIDLTFNVTDGILVAPATGTADFAPVNDVPTVSLVIPDQVTDADSPYTFDASVHFADVDVGDTATYSAELQGGGALPAWLSIGTDTGILSGMPASGDEGTITLVVTRTDAASATVSDTFALTVNNTNSAPVAGNDAPRGGGGVITTPVMVGDEFQVNSFASNKRYPAVAALSNGGYVVIWDSYNQDGSNWGIFAQRYDSAGAVLGNEFQVNSHTSSNQSEPSVTSLSNGGFVVTWTSSGQDGSSEGIYAQRYDSAGAVLGSEFQVNNYTTSNQNESSVTGLPNGGFVVTWASEGQDGSGCGVYGQRYDANGTAVGNEFQVNSYTDSDQKAPAVTSLSDGGFVVTWSSDGQNGDITGLYSQRYDANGSAVGTEFRIDDAAETPTNIIPTVTALKDGGFVVIWQSEKVTPRTFPPYPDVESNVLGQRYDANGMAVGSIFQVNGEFELHMHPTVDGLPDGGFIVSWAMIAPPQFGNGLGIYGHRFDANGAAVGDKFRISPDIFNGGDWPSVAVLADGKFVVTWYPIGGGTEVFGQIFDAGLSLDPLVTDEDTPLTIAASALLENDSDPDGHTLSLSAVSNPVNGTAILDGNGDVLFTPNIGFSGDAYFDYTVSDGHGGTATATVTVSVGGV